MSGSDGNVGRLIHGKWRIDRCLGQGGMGTVYLARDVQIDREVALKFLHPALVEHEEYRNRFEREARVMAQVEHPNLVTLYGIEHDGAAPFLIMKYLPGRPLSRIKRGGPMPLPEVMSVVVQIAAGLSALHARGFVHRDLKPGNIIVDADGHVTVLDFGLTRSPLGTLTNPGTLLGSPQDMAPEQVVGAPLDGRSDLYTLGLLTSELLVGHRPYPEVPDSMLNHLHSEPEPAHVGNPAVPEAVSRVLLKALRKRPADRQPSIAVFLEELVHAANLGALRLPRRHTAEAILDAAVRNAAGSEGVPLGDVPPLATPSTGVTISDLSGVLPSLDERPASEIETKADRPLPVITRPSGERLRAVDRPAEVTELSRPPAEPAPGPASEASKTVVMGKEFVKVASDEPPAQSAPRRPSSGAPAVIATAGRASSPEAEHRTTEGAPPPARDERESPSEAPPTLASTDQLPTDPVRLRALPELKRAVASMKTSPVLPWEHAPANGQRADVVGSETMPALIIIVLLAVTVLLALLWLL